MNSLPKSESKAQAILSTSNDLLLNDHIISADPVVYGFDTGPFTLLHDAYYSAEILEEPKITALPNTAEWLTGLVALRGHLVPVFDIKRFISTETTSSPNESSIVVIGNNEEAAGFSINSLPSRISPDALKEIRNPDVPDIISPAVIKAFTVGYDIWLDLDYPYFFELIGDRVNNIKKD